MEATIKAIKNKNCALVLEVENRKQEIEGLLTVLNCLK
jgi:hypothetical protein